MPSPHAQRHLATAMALVLAVLHLGDERVLHCALHILGYCAYVYKLQTLRSPRFSFVTSDMLPTPFWAYLRGNRRDGAFMRFLGVPVWVFDDLAERMRLKLPRYDRALDSTRTGRRTGMDYIDLTAIALRRFQLPNASLQFLELDFGKVDSTLHKYVDEAKRALVAVLREWPAARVRYPTLAEAQAMYAGLTEQHGKPPVDMGLVCLAIDGTVTPVAVPKDDDVQRLFFGVKGHTTNHILVFSLDGTIVDYSLGNPGSSHDARCAEPIFARHQSQKYNPHRFTMLADSGFMKFANQGHTTGARVYRPLINNEKVSACKVVWGMGMGEATWARVVGGSCVVRYVGSNGAAASYHVHLDRTSSLTLRSFP